MARKDASHIDLEALRRRDRYGSPTTHTMTPGKPPSLSGEPVTTRPVEVARIVAADDRLRPVDPATVDKLADSIDRLGLLQPIGVQVDRH